MVAPLGINMPPGLTPQAQAAAAVERLGVGHVQIRALFLAHGIWFVENLQIAAAAVIDMSMSRELGLSHTQRASLLSCIFVGILLGSLVSGYAGDRWGRRPPVLACYGIAGMAQALAAFAGSCWQVASLRLCIGFAHGLGMPASMALVSESSPASSRMLLMGLRNMLFTFGGIIGAILIVIDSPSLAHLHWRYQTMLVALPPLLWGACAFWLLQESPVFLASIGRQEEALAVLKSMQRLNGHSDNSVEAAFEGCQPTAAMLNGAASCKSGGNISRSLSMIFGRQAGMQMLTLIVGTSTLNAVYWGHGYAFPKFATETGSALPTGYQNLMQQCAGILVNLIILGLASMMTCKSMLILATLVGQAGLMGFVRTASMANRSGPAEFLYLVLENAPSLASNLGFLACYQLSVDLFHVRSRATSAAICVSAGRLAAIVAPFIYEAMPFWQVFYIIMVGMCIVTLLMAIAFLPQKVQQEDADEPLCAKSP